MKNARQAACVVLGLAAALPAGGCGKKPPELKPVPVKGRLLQADKTPYPRAMILRFVPVEEAGRILPSSSALTDERDGSFSAACVPGPCKVTLAQLPTTQGNPAGAGGAPAANAPRMEESGSLRKYLSASTTPWQITIPEGGTDDLELTVFPDGR
jgi:hypothetical protein